LGRVKGNVRGGARVIVGREMGRGVSIEDAEVTRFKDRDKKISSEITGVARQIPTGVVHIEVAQDHGIIRSFISV
jgi:hypothetical protein